MPITRRTFAHLDADSDPTLEDGSAFDSALNIALEPGYITPQGGNVLVPYALPKGVNKRLGGFEDGSTGTAVTLLFNSLGNHRLIRYDPTANAGAGGETTLLEWSGLHLRADLVPQGGVLDGLLVYLDANGEVRSVDLASAAAGGYTPALLTADPYALHVVKRPPTAAPVAMREAIAGLPGNSISKSALSFATRYRYVDGGISVFSPISLLSTVPATTPDPVTKVPLDPLNAVLVTLPTDAPALVRELELLVRENEGPTWLVAHRWDRANGSFPASYSYSGSTTGEALTAAEAAKSTEALWPCRTLTVARGRLVGGYFDEGYRTPAVALTTTLQRTPGQFPPGTTAVQMWELLLEQTDEGASGPPVITRFRRYYGLKTGTYPDPASTYNPYSLGSGGVTFVKGADTLSYAAVFDQPAPASGLVIIEVKDLGPVPTGVPGALPINDYPTFHGRSPYRVGLQFYDEFNRPFGVSSVTTVVMPEQDVLTLPTFLRWELSADAAVQATEIPAAAASYQLVISQADDVLFFQPVLAQTFRYLGDNAQNQPILQDTGALAGKGPIWIDLGELPKVGSGYTFAPDSGDRVRFLDAAGEDYPILYQRGKYIAVGRPVNELTFLSGNDPLPSLTRLEIYTPRKVAGPMYERGPRYPIARTSDGATYTTIFGVLSGDAFVRGVPPTSLSGGYLSVMESMFANEVPHTPNWLDMSYSGRPAYALPVALQKTRRPALIRFSGVKVAGTQLNGLGQWEPLSQYDELAQEQGGITRLSVADQTQTDGSILLVNQERGATSLSLGRSQIQTADGEPLLAITKAVIGGSNALRGGFGCTDPASVVPYAGKVFYYSRHRAELLRYDRNGLTPLGLTYKARTLLEELARTHAGAAVRGAFDPQRKEYRLTYAAVGKLPARTLVFSERREAWAGDSTGHGESGMGVNNELVLFDAGSLWRHTVAAPPATFFGTYTAPQITFTVAQGAGIAKQFRDIAIESGSLWLPTGLVTDTYLNSRTLGSWFTQREGVWRSGLRRAQRLPLPVVPTLLPGILLPAARTAPVAPLVEYLPAPVAPTPVPTLQSEINVISVSASALLVGGRLVALLGGRYIAYDAANRAHAGSLLGLALTTGNAGQQVQVRLSGLATVVGLGLSTEFDYFAGPNGTLVRDPMGLAFVQFIGRAIAPDQLLYDPQDLFIL